MLNLARLPCAYVELVTDATVCVEDLLAHVKRHIHEQAAYPKHVEVMDELHKTAVGKIFKPELRKCAIARVLDAALDEATIPARVIAVIEDKKRGLVAQLTPTGLVDKAKVNHVLGQFSVPWDWAE